MCTQGFDTSFDEIQNTRAKEFRYFEETKYPKLSVKHSQKYVENLRRKKLCIKHQRHYKIDRPTFKTNF